MRTFSPHMCLCTTCFCSKEIRKGHYMTWNWLWDAMGLLGIKPALQCWVISAVLNPHCNDSILSSFLLTHPSYFCLPSVLFMIANVVDCGVTHLKEGLGLGLTHWCKLTLRRWKCRHVGASPHWGRGSADTLVQAHSEEGEAGGPAVPFKLVVCFNKVSLRCIRPPFFSLPL